MSVEGQNGSVWEKLQGKVVSLANTSYGIEAIRNMTSFEDNVNYIEDFKSFGSLSINNFSKVEPSIKVNTLSLDNLVDEKMFVDFGFNEVDKLVGMELPDASKFIEFTNTLPPKKAISIDDKLNQLLEEKKATKNNEINKKDIFLNSLNDNISSKSKTPTQKLESFCILAEKYNSSRSLLHTIRMDNKSEQKIDIVTKTAENKDIIATQPFKKRKNRLKIN